MMAPLYTTPVSPCQRRQGKKGKRHRALKDVEGKGREGTQLVRVKEESIDNLRSIDIDACKRILGVSDFIIII